MEASSIGPLNLPPQPFVPNLEKVRDKLVKRGVLQPSPRIIHNLRNKEIQKFNRRQAKEAAAKKLPPLPSDAQRREIAEESHFQLIKSEYRKFIGSGEREKLVGKPWEGLEKLRLRESSAENSVHVGDRLNPEHLKELSDILERERDKFSWLLENDIEIQEEWFEEDEEGKKKWLPKKRSEAEAIKLLIDRLASTKLGVKDWKFTRIMRFSGLQFTEKQMLRILEGLGNGGQWENALSVVEYVYNSKHHRHHKSRFVYTKLLAVLGRARKPKEALRVFNSMRADAFTYPDMAAYHSLAVTLGQSGFLRELISVVESMRVKPNNARNVKFKSWSPELEPDIVIFNAILNACVPTCQWKGVSWVFQQIRSSGLTPNGASYGLAMEVMLKSGKYDLVHLFFDKMRRNGEALNALTYKVLVRAFWEEGKVNEAIEAVRDMERWGVVGAASVYYELARCLCFYGRREEALSEINRMENLRVARKKPLAVTLTGMIMSSLDGGHVDDCIALYEHSKGATAPDIGLINAMLKVYGRNDMFPKAKEIFEGTKKTTSGDDSPSFPTADEYSFGSMLEASASALQWEYFDHIYKDMILSGYRIDPIKHCSLLVKASKAGKWHLLEHAVEGMLEEGNVPPPSAFAELICQAVTRRDYGRAAKMINATSYAPFRLDFQEWTDWFRENEDRLRGVRLPELRDELLDRGLAKELTAVNFSSALEFIIRTADAKTGGAAADDDDDDDDDNAVEGGGGWTSLPSTGDVPEKGKFDFFEDFSDAGIVEANLDDDDDDDDDGASYCPPSAYEILQLWNM